MNEYVLNYPDNDIVVKGIKQKDYILIPKSQLPKGKFPNGKNEMYKEGILYKIESIHKNHICSFVICIILIVIGIYFIIYQKNNIIDNISEEFQSIISN